MKTGEVDGIIEAALREDLPSGDITSENIIPPDSVSEAVILAKEKGILAGIGIARMVFEKIDPSVEFRSLFIDGQSFEKGDVLARVRGNSVSLFKGERTALNFLQRLSGIATKTRRFVEAVQGTRTGILDTRKTTPGLRLLEKYAVKAGGGENHRLNLSEMVLIKDNHIRHVGSIAEAVSRARKAVGPGVKIEVEVTSSEEAEEAVSSGADWVMLDNMPLKEMRKVVDRIRGKVLVEASGKMTLGKVKKIASLEVDFISVGALTHSFNSVDISLEFLEKERGSEP